MARSGWRSTVLNTNIAPLKEKFRTAVHEAEKLYPDAGHAEDRTTLIKLASVVPYDLQEQMVDHFGVIGDPDYCTKRLLEIKSWGVEHVYLHCGARGTFQFPEYEAQAFREVIGPALNKASGTKAASSR